MNRGLLFASVVALAAGPALVGADDQAKQSSTSLSGCLRSTAQEGVYQLKTKSDAKDGETRDVEVRGQAALTDHVGHEVELTGSWMTDTQEHARTGIDNTHFVVSGIQHLSEACRTE
jgi:hypothetical protein